MLPTRNDMAGISWRLYEGNPVIHPPALSPIVADPTVLVPEASPDGRWHLFAHAVHGMYHFRSGDGILWEKPRRVFRHAMRPFIFHEAGTYYLFYERYRKFHIYLSMLPMKWSSRIEVRTSRDLRDWSEPVMALAPSLPWHRDARYGESVSNPCLVRRGDEYILYYSASLVRVEDCGFNEPLYIGRARAKCAAGPYEPDPEPMLAPDPADPWRNLGCGSIKVYPCSDGFVAYQNGIYLDEKRSRSGSAISLLSSDDGVRWRGALSGPVLRPGEGWMRSHIYACDLARREKSRELYLYFNARDDWHWSRGREHIGLLIGRFGR